ncbi:MAG: flagellin [Terracidiphilus sp.]|jgi:flagellin
MSLGVLNNLSAVYAENNLNNTNSSLNTVLQQLSSGSKINSGADDAAGLSLVNGLQANQSALMQSETNATEGSGLLQVADGALSQVTSLLNRAVTLATEASNGTLNSSQDTAANQEYQSILSEISNIGSTTTYNQEQVFNSNTNIYTGDSSTTGSSIDDLNIRALSSSNVGDTGGVMAYSNGSNNTFIDLSKSGTLATVSDQLNTTAGGTKVVINYLATGANGAVVQKAATIAVGGTTAYANTTAGMIDAINGAGLGVTATFTTANAAGTAAVTAAKTAGGTGADTGIEISGPAGGVGAGATPGEIGHLDGTVGGGADGDALSGTLTIKGATAAPVSIDLGTLSLTTSNIGAYFSTGAGSSLGITATDTAGVVEFTSAKSGISITAANLDDTTNTSVPTYTADSYYSVGASNEANFAANGLADSATGQNANAGFTSDTNGVGGVATISYSDAAGQSLSATDLTSSADAQSALTSLNAAITDVSAQDGYIGAMINTLNSVSSVLGTQQENVQSAQNAVQATDYAQATSNMSKYEILSQTGIAALAQANSQQQDVLKLLQ